MSLINYIAMPESCCCFKYKENNCARLLFIIRHNGTSRIGSGFLSKIPEENEIQMQYLIFYLSCNFSE